MCKQKQPSHWAVLQKEKNRTPSLMNDYYLQSIQSLLIEEEMDPNRPLSLSLF